MILVLCRGDQCRLHGARALHAIVQARLAIGWHETTADGRVTLLPADCISLCNGAPCGSIDGRSLTRLTPERLDAALGNDTPTIQ